MTLFDIADYEEQFDSFVTAMDADTYDSYYSLPRGQGHTPFVQLFEQLVDRNPARFLFG